MRLKKGQHLICGALLVNLIILYYFWRLQSSFDRFGDSAEPRLVFAESLKHGNIHDSDHVLVERLTFDSHRTSPVSRLDLNTNNIGKLLTVIFREYEFFENDIRETVQSFLKVLPDVRIIVLADAYPYPPLKLPVSKFNGNGQDVRVIVLHPQIDEPTNASKPELNIATPFALIVPDSIRITSVKQVAEMISQLVMAADYRDVAPGDGHKHMSLSSSYRLVAAKVSGEKARCIKYLTRLREWTLELSNEAPVNVCDGIQGTVVLLVKTKDLFDLSQPFARPLPHALFIQTVVRHWKVRILDKTVFQQGRPLFLDNHLKWKRSNTGKERLKMLYEDFRIKKVILRDGSDSRGNEDVEWYGCNKQTSRCFGTVLHDTPEYLFSNRWTPPCCLEGLRETARHVFQTLKSCGVRYWLEGGSLLGASRSGDIIPWDYDVDVGIYEADVNKCGLLRDSTKRSVITPDGFVWEKAIEGDFYRVQYSQTNHLHVDLFPFYSMNGIMTKKTWFKTHRQDTEFPEHYLRPLATINFVGVEASAPNNIREFLELKFGEGVIENPQYPNPKLVAFPNLSMYRT